MSVRVVRIQHQDETRVIYLPEGWDEGVRMGNPSDSSGMTYVQTHNLWVDEDGKTWVEF